MPIATKREKRRFPTGQGKKKVGSHVKDARKRGGLIYSENEGKGRLKEGKRRRNLPLRRPGGWFFSKEGNPWKRRASPSTGRRSPVCGGGEPFQKRNLFTAKSFKRYFFSNRRRRGSSTAS